MAAPKPKDASFHVDLNLQEEHDDKMELEFQDFSMDSADKIVPSTSYSDDNVNDVEESAKLLIEPEETKRQPSFWEFAYYQSFFDVSTNQVLNRVVWSVIPRPSRATYIHQCIRPNPDLYGPFWICATLVFAIAVSGNMADYLHTQGKQKEIWHYDFHKVSLAATAIYSYVFVVPLALWGTLWYRKSAVNYTLLEIMCAYGYSLAVYVPIAVLCVVPIHWIQWTLVSIGFVLSAVVLMLTFWPAVREDTKKVTFGVLLAVVVLHMALAIGFMAYFFTPSASSSMVDPTMPQPRSTVISGPANEQSPRDVRNPESFLETNFTQNMADATTRVFNSTVVAHLNHSTTLLNSSQV